MKFFLNAVFWNQFQTLCWTFFDLFNQFLTKGEFIDDLQLSNDKINLWHKIIGIKNSHIREVEEQRVDDSLPPISMDQYADVRMLIRFLFRGTYETLRKWRYGLIQTI